MMAGFPQLPGGRGETESGRVVPKYVCFPAIGKGLMEKRGSVFLKP